MPHVRVLNYVTVSGNATIRQPRLKVTCKVPRLADVSFEGSPLLAQLYVLEHSFWIAWKNHNGAKCGFWALGTSVPALLQPPAQQDGSGQASYLRRYTGQATHSKAGKEVCSASHGYFITRDLICITLPGLSGWDKQVACEICMRMDALSFIYLLSPLYVELASHGSLASYLRGFVSVTCCNAASVMC